MSKLLTLGWTAGAAVLSCLMIAFGFQDEKPPRAAAPERTIRELKSQLVAPGTAVRIDRAIETQRIYLVDPAREPAALRLAVASLLDYSWEEESSASGPVLRLTQGPGRSTLAARLRRRAETQATELLRARLRLIRQAFQRREGAVEALARHFPADFRQLQSVEAGRRLPLLGLLDEAGIDRLLTTGLWISPPLHSPRESFGAYARRAFPKESYVIRGGERQEVMDHYADARSDMRLSLRIVGEPDSLGMLGGPTDFTRHEPSRHQPPGQRMPPGIGADYPADSFLAPPPVATGGPRARTDPRLGRRVRFNPEGAGERLSYPEALARLAEVSRLRIISDRFASTRLRFLKPLDVGGELPLDELLDRIARAFQYTWRLEGRYLLFRHARWHYEELAELPERIERQLALTVEKQKGLSLQDLLDLSGALGREQFFNLASYYADLKMARNLYLACRIFQSLAPGERAAATPPGGLPFSDLSPPQVALFLEYTQQRRPDLLEKPEEERREWRLWVVEEDEPPGWSIGFVWDDANRRGARLPAFVPVKPNAAFFKVANYPPNHWRPPGFRRVLEQHASAA